MVKLAKFDRVQINIQNEAMVVEGVHGVTAIGEDLFSSLIFKQDPPKEKILI